MAERTFDVIRMQRDELRAWLETAEACTGHGRPELEQIRQRCVVEARKIAKVMLEDWHPHLDEKKS